MADDDENGEYENYEADDFEKDDDEYDVMPNDKDQAASPKMRPDRRRRSSAGGLPVHRQSQPGVSSPLRQSHNALPDRGLTDKQRTVGLKRLKLSLAKRPHVTLSAVIMDDMYAVAPISQVELYGMARSVYANKRIGSTQTNDDAKAVDVQTDEVDKGEQACQVPEDLSHATARDVTVQMTKMDPAVERKLGNFVLWAGPLVLAALGMAPRTKTLAIPHDNAGKGMTGGSLKLEHPALNNRPVNAVAYDPGSSPNLLVAHAPVNASIGAAELLKDHSLGSRGCLAVWDLSEVRTPAHMLISEGTPLCCCWAPPPTVGMVFAGMEEGGVCVWDLEEPASHHPSEVLVPKQPAVLTRRPSYSTECSALETLAAPIVAIASLAKEGSRMTPCHVVSLTAWGEVTVYTVSVLNAQEMANADIDLGMRFGSKVRLLKTSSNIKLGMNVLMQPSRKAAANQLLATFCLGVFPGQSRQFIVGSDGGKVLRGSWVGQPPAPKEYLGDLPPKTMAAATAASSMPQIAATITSLHISPFCAQAFIAGHSDGSVVLHSSEFSRPVYVWPTIARSKIVVVRWSPSRPCAFFALDAMCTLYAFDLLSKNRSAPVFTETFMSKDRTAFATTFETAHIFNGPTGPGDGKASYALGFDDGHVMIHLLSKKHLMTEAGGNEMKTLAALCEAPSKLAKKVVPELKFEGDVDLPPPTKPPPKKKAAPKKVEEPKKEPEE